MTILGLVESVWRFMNVPIDRRWTKVMFVKVRQANCVYCRTIPHRLLGQYEVVRVILVLFCGHAL
jgi:hypothetical protein